MIHNWPPLHFVKAALAALVASSPEALDTLNELAAALGNDPNFATTMTNALAGKQPLDNTLTALSGKSVSGPSRIPSIGRSGETECWHRCKSDTGYVCI